VSVVSRSATNEQNRGGDIFHASALSEDATITVLADMSSKGAAAKRHVEAFLAAFRSEARESRRPAHILSGLNASRAAIDENTFACAFVAYFGRATGTVTYASAGHDLALLLSGRRHVHLEPTGPALGIIERAAFRERSMPFHENDALLIATDGFTECRKSADQSRMFGSAGIVRAVHALDAREADLAEAVARAADAFTAGLYRDDATVACIANVRASTPSGFRRNLPRPPARPPHFGRFSDTGGL